MKILMVLLSTVLLFQFFPTTAYARETQNPVCVNHEWGTLQEVIVGTGEWLIYPSYHPSISFLYDKEYLEWAKKYGGQPAIEVDPEEAEVLKTQMDKLVKILQNNGIKVHRPKKLNKTEAAYLNDVQKGCSYVFSRDPILIVGNNIIETSLKIPFREKEKFQYRKLLKKLAKERGANYVAIPSPSPDFGEENIYLEGGDVLLNGYDIYVGNSGNASNSAGVKWLQNYLGTKYRVHEIKLTDTFEHLDCVMSLVRPGLMVIYEDAFVDDLPEGLKDWEKIKVSLNDAKKLACNIFIIKENLVIVDSRFDNLAKALRDKDVKVIQTPYCKVAEWGGAFRCSHHPIFRNSEL